MTGGMYVPDRAVQEAQYWANIGYHEGAANRNVFAQWQYGNAYNPWCDSFVCYCSYMGGYRFGANGGAHYACGERGDFNVGAHHQHAVTDGTWRAGSIVARPGWLVVLSFGIPDQHIELVLSDQGGDQLATIGGNTSDRCAYRTRSRSNVVGFVALDQAGQNAGNVFDGHHDPHDPSGGLGVKPTDRTDAVRTNDGGRLLLGADGGVFAYGTGFFNSLPGIGVHLDLTKTYACSILPTAGNKGYWVLTTDGAVFTFGDAQFRGTFAKDLPLHAAVGLIGDPAVGYKAIRDDGALLTPKT